MAFNNILFDRINKKSDIVPNNKIPYDNLSKVATSGNAEDIYVKDISHKLNSHNLEAVLQQLALKDFDLKIEKVSGNTDEAFSSKYIFKLNDKIIPNGEIAFAKDLIDTKGELVTIDNEGNNGVFIKMVIGNSEPFFINITDLIDVNADKIIFDSTTGESIKSIIDKLDAFKADSILLDKENNLLKLMSNGKEISSITLELKEEIPEIKSIAIPKLANENEQLVYNGKEQEKGFIVNRAIIDVSGNVGTNAGIYTATFSIRDKLKYQWEDGTQSDKSIEWNIEKAQGSFEYQLDFNKDSIIFDKEDNLSVLKLLNVIGGDISVYSAKDETELNDYFFTVNISKDTTKDSYYNIKPLEFSNYNQNYAKNGYLILRQLDNENYNPAPIQKIKVTYDLPKVYEVVWDGTANSKLSRTTFTTLSNPIPYYEERKTNGIECSSPFDNIYPWSDIKVIKTKEYGALVEIPKFYYSWIKNTSGGFTLGISDKPSSFKNNIYHVSPAHADRGDGQGERDKVYVGRYFCNGGWVNGQDMKSLSGATPKSNYSLLHSREKIHSLGKSCWLWDYSMFTTILMLFLVEYTTINCQNALGIGGTKAQLSGGRFDLTGGTDNMTYYSGTNATNLESVGNIAYRGIEGLWDNYFAMIDGLITRSFTMYSQKNPNKFSDYDSYVEVGEISNKSGYYKDISISKTYGYEHCFFPSEVYIADDNHLTYFADYISIYDEKEAPLIYYTGGGANRGYEVGLFYWGMDIACHSEFDFISSRLMILPDKDEVIKENTNDVTYHSN